MPEAGLLLIPVLNIYVWFGMLFLKDSQTSTVLFWSFVVGFIANMLIMTKGQDYLKRAFGG